MPLFTRDNREVNQANAGLNQPFFRLGFDKIGEHLLSGREELLKNFMMSGSEISNYYQVLGQYMHCAINRQPIIIIHHHREIEHFMLDMINNVSLSVPSFIVGDNRDYYYEPLLDMSDDECVFVLHRLAVHCGYVVNSVFDVIAYGMLNLIHISGERTSLTTLNKICRISSIKEFFQHVSSLPNPQKCNQIIATFSLDKDSHLEQYQIFRNLIRRFAMEMKQSGWKDSEVDSHAVNSRMLIANNGIMIYAVEDTYSELFFDYLSIELCAFRMKPALLILDNILIRDYNFIKYLLHPGANFSIGLIADDLPSYIIEQDNIGFNQLAERTEVILLTKHRIAPTAKAFSEVFGNFDELMEQKTSGTSREAWRLFATPTESDGTSTSIQNRYRVMPERLISMPQDSIVIFNTETNQLFDIQVRF